MVSFNVDEPASTQQKTVAAVNSLDGILSPVLLQDSDGLVDTLVFNNQTGTTTMTWEDLTLQKKQIMTDENRVIYPTSAIAPGSTTDLVAQLSALSAAGKAKIIDSVNTYLRNLLLFNDRYLDHNLLAGSGIDRCTDGNDDDFRGRFLHGVPGHARQDRSTLTAQKHEDFLAGTGYTVHYTTAPNPDPTKSICSMTSPASAMAQA